jgi:inosose dehydratase
MAPRRIQHVHLKDIDDDLASRVRRGQISYHDAVRQGLFRPLGEGDAKIEEVVTHLESSGYGGWYVLEQDVALAEEPPPGSGPLLSVKSSLDYLNGLQKKLRDARSPSAESCHDPRGEAA